MSMSASNYGYEYNVVNWPGRYIQDASTTCDSIAEYQEFEGTDFEQVGLDVDPKYKTELCKNFTTKGYCKYDKRCRFAHGKQELISKKVNCFYKQKQCESFFKKGFCPYGSRCTFIHDVRTLLSIKNPFKHLVLEKTKILKKTLDFGFEITENQIRRLSIFTDITDEKTSFESKKTTEKIKKKRKLFCESKIEIEIGMERKFETRSAIRLA